MPELGDIPLRWLARRVQAALLRLHLAVTGETHRLLTDYGKGVRELLLSAAGENGTLDAVQMFSVTTEATVRWGETFGRWQRLFGASRHEAAAIALGRLAREHQGMMALRQAQDEIRRSRQRRSFGEQAGEASPVFQPQLQALIDAANRRLYSDGFQLSDRIWRLDRESLEGIRRTLMQGIAEGDSAWNVAKKVEEFLGADAECPRWTSTRLYKLTPTERVTSRKGLYSRMADTPCESKGVAYNALRMARNEIQILHHAATDELMRRAPWMEKEQVLLSPDHPPIGCECEDITAGGEGGEGIYPVGQVSLPIHVQCLPAGQKVETPEGNRAIEDIRVDDLVLTHRGRFRPITRTFVRQYEGDLIKITTRAGREILVTPDHPILADGTWKAASALEAGDLLFVPSNGSAFGNRSGKGESQ